MKKTELTSKMIHREKGQSMVEFAVSLVIILVLLAGVVDLGRMFFYYIAMRDAAQEGVLYGSAYPGNCEQIALRVSDLLSSDAPSVTVYINNKLCSDAKAADIALGSGGPKDGCNPNPIKIVVEDTNFKLTMPFIGAIVGENNKITLNATAIGGVVRYQCK